MKLSSEKNPRKLNADGATNSILFVAPLAFSSRMNSLKEIRTRAIMI